MKGVTGCGQSSQLAVARDHVKNNCTDIRQEQGTEVAFVYVSTTNWSSYIAVLQQTWSLYRAHQSREKWSANTVLVFCALKFTFLSSTLHLLNSVDASPMTMHAMRHAVRASDKIINMDSLTPPIFSKRTNSAPCMGHAHITWLTARSRQRSDQVWAWNTCFKALLKLPYYWLYCHKTCKLQQKGVFILKHRCQSAKYSVDRLKNNLYKNY